MVKKRIKLRHSSVMCALRDKPTDPIRSACVLLVDDDDDNHADADADADDEYLPTYFVGFIEGVLLGVILRALKHSETSRALAQEEIDRCS